jgi:DNA-binding LacI/PurR family transcriptional regulator
MVTIKDIAQRAGVSTTTVSRILNGRETGVAIREETRQKVLALASELGYRPNLMARALRGNQSHLLGVLAQNITSLFHSQILRGLNEVAEQRSYRVFLGHVQRQVEIAVDYGSMFEQAHADGILIIGHLEGDKEALARLTQHHQYVVGVSDRTEDRTFPGVYGDNIVGTQLALDHLWELGHRKIICVTDSSIADGVLRAEVYRRYMYDKNSSHHIQIVQTSRDIRTSCTTGQQLFAHSGVSDQPTAIFAATDAIAIGLIQAAYLSGIRIPEDVSLVGFDDIDIAEFIVPPLTTVRQSGVEMGRVATKLLLDMIEQQQDRSQVSDIVLTPTLVVRRSTAMLT